MRRYLSLVICILACAACTDKNRLPSGILPQSKMQDLVWDVMVAEEYSKELRIKDTAINKDFKKERSAVYQQVFDLHKTSRQDFIKSFNFYASRPDLTKILFDSLTQKSNRRRDEALRERIPRLH